MVKRKPDTESLIDGLPNEIPLDASAYPAERAQALDRNEIRELARQYKWEEDERHTAGGIMMTFIRILSPPGQNQIRQKVEIWPSTGTVATMLRHPKKGRSKLYRRNIDLEKLRRIFNNPRAHLGSGYYQKRSK